MLPVAAKVGKTGRRTPPEKKHNCSVSFSHVGVRYRVENYWGYLLDPDRTRVLDTLPNLHPDIRQPQIFLGDDLKIPEHRKYI